MSKNQVINNIAIKLVELSENGHLNINSIKEILVLELSGYKLETESTELATTNKSVTEELFKYFAVGKLGANKSKETIRQYKRVVNQLCTITGKELSDITSDDINVFMVKYKNMFCISDSTMESKRLYLSSVFSFLFKHGKIKKNPMVMIEPVKCCQKVKTPLSNEEIEKIRVACEEDKRSRAIIDFFVDTGVRVSELCGISLQDVDFTQRRCKVFGKGNKERYVYFSGNTAVRLKEYLYERKDIHWSANGVICNVDTPLFASTKKNERMHKAGIHSIIKGLRKLSGVIRLHCHLFRATYATNLAKLGVDINIIAHALGHANLNTISRYVLLSEGQIDTAIRNVGFAS